jgi:hypothetical protein
MPIKDSLIALPLATLNRRGFEPAQFQLLDPTA